MTAAIHSHDGQVAAHQAAINAHFANHNNAVEAHAPLRAANTETRSLVDDLIAGMGDAGIIWETKRIMRTVDFNGHWQQGSYFIDYNPPAGVGPHVNAPYPEFCGWFKASIINNGFLQQCWSYDSGRYFSRVYYGAGSILTLWRQDAQLTAWGRTGDGWYRQFNDGFVMQGGTKVLSGAFGVFNFYLPFPQTAYTVQATISNTNTTINSPIKTEGDDASTFSVKAGGGTKFFWFATGY